MDRRRFVGALAGAGALRALLPRPTRAQTRPSQIAVMTWGGAWGESQAAGVDAAFTAQTGVRVVQDRTVSPGDRITKARVNLSNQIYDVMWLPDALATVARRQGVLEPLDRAAPQLSNLADIHPRFLSSDYVAIMFSAAGVAYNPKYVTTPLASFADLWRPEFKGRIVVQSFGHSFGPAMVAVGALAAGRDPKDVDAGFDMIERLTKLDPIWVGDTDGLLNAYRNEEAIAGILYRSQAFTLEAGGAKVNWVYPKEGAIAISWGAGIVKNTKNLEVAQAYINAACDPKNQVQFTRTHNYPGSNRRMVGYLPAELKARATWSDEELARLIELDHDFMAEQRTAWSERWNRIVAR